MPDHNIQRPKMKSTINYDYKMGKEIVSRQDQIQYLGLKFDSSMRWNKHIREICSKAHRTIWMLWGNLYKAPPPLKTSSIHHHHHVQHCYGTRHASTPDAATLQQYLVSVDVYGYSLLPHAVPKWNKFPASVRTAPSLESFKAKLEVASSSYHCIYCT